MSNALATLQEELKSLANQVQKPSGFNIKTANKMFTMPDGSTNEGPLECIILDWRNVNSYYPNVYNSKAPENPKCYAINKDINMMIPGDDVPEPISEDCATCKYNEFGSGANGRGKACKNSVRLAIVPPDAKKDTQPWILTVAPTSLTDWSNYVNTLASTAGVLPLQVITAIAFDASQTYPKLKFGNPQPHDKIDVAMGLRPTAATLLNASPIR